MALVFDLPPGDQLLHVEYRKVRATANIAMYRNPSTTTTLLNAANQSVAK